MQKKSLSSLELTAVVNELQFLTKGKFTQVYHQEKEVLFQLHARNKGKYLLKAVSGKYLCLTDRKMMLLNPSGFGMQLRKYLNNAFIQKIYQKDSERIVVFEVEKIKQEYNLIIELFSKGNIVLTDKNYTIIAALEAQIWKEREVKVRMEYVFPVAGFDWKKINEKELTGILKKSDKKNLATALAMEIGLGGLYAEEACKLNNINSQKLPKEITPEEAGLIVKTIKGFLKKIETPKGYVYEEEITPFPLKGREIKSETESYNQAVDLLNLLKRTTPYQQKIKVLEKTIFEQEEAIKKLEERIELNRKKGELIYEKYSPLQKLREIVKEMRKTKDWNEISQELKKQNKIKEVDLKNKRIIMEL